MAIGTPNLDDLNRSSLEGDNVAVRAGGDKGADSRYGNPVDTRVENHKGLSFWAGRRIV